MARDPSGVYSYPPGTEGVPDHTIGSNSYNAFVEDIQADLNLPRPVTAGGTGAVTAPAAIVNLGGETAGQIVTNYDSFPFVTGSFYSAAGATSAPTAGAIFTGTVVVVDASTTTINAINNGTGVAWVRRKVAGVWSAWEQQAVQQTAIDAQYVNVGGDTMTGHLSLPITPAADQATRRDYVDAGVTAATTAASNANTAAGNAQTTANTAVTNAASANTNANSRVIRTGDTMTGDLTVHRNNTTGYVFLGSNGGARYVGYDGSNYVFNGAHVFSNAGRLWGTGDGTPIFTGGGTISGNLTVTGTLTVNSTLAVAGALNVTGILSTGTDLNAGGRFQGVGYRCRTGVSGGFSGNYFNWLWSVPTFLAYVDDVNVGGVSSDYRIKDNVIDLRGTWDIVKKLRPIEYNHKDYTPPTVAAQERAKETGAPFVAGSSDKHWGFLAHELQETLLPTAASGVKDDPGVIQSPNPFVLIAALTKALQEAMTRIEVLEGR